MKRIVVQGVSLAVCDAGCGKPIILLHGFPLDHSMWNDQIEALSDTYRVIAPDLRGHGSSEVTEGTVTMRQMADDVAGLLEPLDITEPVTLCGLSMGGYVAFEFNRQYRGRLARLILCNTRAASDTREVARGREMMAAQIISAGANMAVDSMLPKLFSPLTYQAKPEIVDSVRQVILATDPRTIAATQRGMAQRQDMTARLVDVGVPTLVICGAEDQITPPHEMQAMAAALPRGSYVEIEQAGHLTPLEQATAVHNSINDFLSLWQ